MEPSTKKFLIVWAGQTVSVLGSGFTSFALGIWVYQRTGLITDFALISVCVMLPGIIVSPFAGALVDRFNRRDMMILSDITAGCSSLMLALLFLAGILTVAKVYLLVSLGSIATAVRMPSYMALLSQLLPNKQLGRASGMMQMGPAVTGVLSPILAASMLGKINFPGVVAVDCATFVAAVATLVAIKVPTVPSHRARQSLLKEVIAGWAYIRERPGLTALLLFFAAMNISNSSAQVLFTPIILSFAGRAVLGRIMSIGALGFLAGSVLMSAWGGPERRVRGILGFALIYDLALILGGLRASAPLITVALFVMVLQFPLVNGCSQAIWQSKTELQMQGRLFSTRMVIAWSSAPLSALLAGRLADRVFDPLFSIHGELANRWFAVVGSGPGRGAAFLLVLNGVVALAITIACCFNRNLWRLEQEMPDVMRASAPSPASV